MELCQARAFPKTHSPSGAHCATEPVLDMTCHKHVECAYSLMVTPKRTPNPDVVSLKPDTATSSSDVRSSVLTLRNDRDQDQTKEKRRPSESEHSQTRAKTREFWKHPLEESRRLCLASQGSDRPAGENVVGLLGLVFFRSGWV